jgi:DNA-binding transcriptional ArsR family regulator
MAEEQARRVGVEALKALAHPLRVRIFTELTSYGPATASALAARLRESSGSTSYHLRQLERHGYVREDPDRGNGRDRWWERVPGPIEFGDATTAESPDAKAAGEVLEREFRTIEDERYTEYLRGRGGLPPDWVLAATTGSAALQLTAAEMDGLITELWTLIGRYRSRTPTDGARRVDVQLRAFPVVDKEGSA